MIPQILVPLDGSVHAESALAVARAVARATGRELTLLRVVPTPIIVEPIIGLPPPRNHLADCLAADLESAIHYLQEVAGRLPGAVQTVALQGDPATAIVAYAEQHPQIVLIAMATHGRTGLSRWVLGSVADAVLHAAPVPLLLSRPGAAGSAALPPRGASTILVPLDGSAFAAQALDPACALATATGATVVLLGAHEPGARPAGDAGPSGVAPDRQNGVLHLEEHLRATATRLAAAGIPVTTQLVQGPPAQVILDQCEHVPADLIVMATHGRQGLQRLRLGSVAWQVVQGATRPVLLYRHPAGPVLPLTGGPHATGRGGAAGE